MALTLQQLFEDLEHGRYLALPGYSKCYVDGCYRNAVVGRLHKLTGPVDACDCHDPEKVGYALPFSVLHPAPAEEPVQAPEETPGAEPQPTNEEIIAQLLAELIRRSQNGDGNGGGPGKGAKLVKPKPNLPPSGIGLRTPPATDPNVKRF